MMDVHRVLYMPVSLSVCRSVGPVCGGIVRNRFVRSFKRTRTCLDAGTRNLYLNRFVGMYLGIYSDPCACVLLPRTCVFQTRERKSMRIYTAAVAGMAGNTAPLLEKMDLTCVDMID